MLMLIPIKVSLSTWRALEEQSGTWALGGYLRYSGSLALRAFEHLGTKVTKDTKRTQVLGHFGHLGTWGRKALGHSGT